MNEMQAEALSTQAEALSTTVESGFSERRTGRRYEVSLKVRWKIMHRRRLLEAGTGMTLEMSSGGILFKSEQRLPPENTIELAIAWPVLLHNTLPLQLIISGRVLRISGQHVAVRILQHEFRTARAASIL